MKWAESTETYSAAAHSKEVKSHYYTYTGTLHAKKGGPKRAANLIQSLSLTKHNISGKKKHNFIDVLEIKDCACKSSTNFVNKYSIIISQISLDCNFKKHIYFTHHKIWSLDFLPKERRAHQSQHWAESVIWSFSRSQLFVVFVVVFRVYFHRFLRKCIRARVLSLRIYMLICRRSNSRFLGSVVVVWSWWLSFVLQYIYICMSMTWMIYACIAQ